MAAVSAWTIEERKRILMNHIYGVDIDPQAVEVTKLSLLLKVLEGEGVAGQMSLFPSAPCPTWGATSSAATRSSGRSTRGSSTCPTKRPRGGLNAILHWRGVPRRDGGRRVRANPTP